MIKEYQTEYGRIAESNDYGWLNKMSVDLQWIAAAYPSESKNFTYIQLCGSQYTQLINAKYEDFMVDWLAAKGIQQ